MVAAAAATEVELTWPGLWSPHPATTEASSSARNHISGLKKLPDLDMCFSWALGPTAGTGYFPPPPQNVLYDCARNPNNPVSRRWHIRLPMTTLCSLPYKAGNCGFRLRGASVIKTLTALIEPCKST